MKAKFSLFSLIVLLVLSACHQPIVEPQNTNKVTDAVVSGSDLSPVARPCRTIPSQSQVPFDAVQVNSVRLAETCLYINVSYSGGCENHEFDLTWDGSVLESLPPQLPLRLHHDSNGDQCEAWLTRTISFSVDGLELAGYNEVILRVIDTEGGVETVLYQY